MLSSESHVPIAAVPANPVAPVEKTKIRLKRELKTISLNILKKKKNAFLATATVTSSGSTIAAVAPPLTAVKPRRVLPEHEGKYKIKLPSGTTERSKQILAKQAKCESHLFLT